MPRVARRRSETGIYHVVSRGVAQQKIFHGEEDFSRYLELLKKTSDKSECIIYGYCLMENHVHLLLKETKEDIGQIMRRLGTSYAGWYNWKYERFGHVFQDRYRSECIEDDKYLMAVIRYIHNNPVNAKITEIPENYKWSSCKGYYGQNEPLPGLINTKFILGFLADNKDKAVEGFRQLMEQQDDSKYLEYERVKRASDEEVRAAIEKLLKGKPISVLKQMGRTERDKVLKQVKDMEGSRLRQISRITGIGYSIIARADHVS